MNKPVKFKRTQKRTFSAHHMLISAARRAHERAEKQEVGWVYDVLSTMTFSALAIEALCNAIGQWVYEDWKDFESSSPIANIRLLAERLDVDYDKEVDPWSTVLWLLKFRNLIAHPKPEQVVEEILLTQKTYDRDCFGMPNKPESKLEKWITLGNSKRALLAAEQIEDILTRKIPSNENTLGLHVDGWVGSTELHNDA